MKRILGVVFAALVMVAPAVYAHDHSKSIAGAAQGHGTMVMAMTMAEGEVRKIDKEQRKVTVKHGEIKSLEMPPMTMVFRVKDAALLDKVKEGDKIMFAAEKIEGNITITQIEAVKK